MTDIICDFCNKNFPTSNGLWNHVVKMHNESILTLPKKEFPCEHCRLSYASKQCLEKHVRKDHKKHISLETYKELQAQNKALLAIVEKLVGHTGVSVNNFTSISSTTTKYFLSIDSRKMRDSINMETFLVILEHRREALYKYLIYCHVNKDNPESASFKLIKDEHDTIHAERYDTEEKTCDHIDLINEIMRYRMEDMEYLLSRLPFDKDLSKSDKTSAWYDQYVVRKHIHELKTDPNMWSETRDSIVFYTLESMKLFYGST